MGLLFGPTMHAELLKRCTDILRLMSIEQKLTCEHLDTIWNAVQVRHTHVVARLVFISVGSARGFFNYPYFYRRNSIGGSLVYEL